MSIRDRLEDTRILMSANRREGAFIHVLIAAAATSKKRYSKELWEDRDAFKNFIHDELGIITGAFKYGVTPPFRGKDTPIESILYHELRCQLLHEGEMPRTVRFTDPVIKDGQSYSILQLGDPMGIPVSWIETIATAVWLAPENDDLWPDDRERRQTARDQFGDLKFDGLYCRRPKARMKRKEYLTWTHNEGQFSVKYDSGISCASVADALDAKATELRSTVPC